ncbi:MAG: sigma 54-interacting transcriptional regulator [Desulfobacterales bacterium]|nr:sigma 54-interacting transcriptional regulator [Desulfobacterales bacterium]
MEVIGESSGLARVIEQVGLVSCMETSVLLLGETGVGKGMIASLIHNGSMRKSGPFVSVNCGAIPETLVDSELFGHEKGAFTGAVTKKQGRFERADKGSIFLDEIGELPLPAQVRLLNVLQTREIERVGGHCSLPVSIRVISATHRNLENMVAEGAFREDLWFRLNVFPIHIPPLRRRKADIPDLARHFIRKKAEKLKIEELPVLGERGIRQLAGYHWPGNVRELENIVERAMICCRGNCLDFSGIIAARNEALVAECNTIARSTFMSLDQVNRIHINKALESAKGKINGPGGAASLLNIHPNTLRKRMDRLGIPYGKKRSFALSG